MKRARFSRILSKTIRKKAFQFSPVRLARIFPKGKERIIYKFSLVDRVVHGVLGTLLSEAVEQSLSKHLYSYRKGISHYTAVSNFAEYVREHRKQIKDVKSRGLYVIRADIKSYTDTIPLTERSPLWPLLETKLSVIDMKVRESIFWELLQQSFRPMIENRDKVKHSPIIGSPTGSPLTAPLYNIYLRELDLVLKDFSNGFYARYSDDLIFAHPSHEVTRAAYRALRSVLSDHELTTHSADKDILYFNGAARNSEQAPHTIPCDTVTFLGGQISFHGTISVPEEMNQSLLKEIGGRVKRAVVSTPRAEQRGRIACRVINESLNRENLCAASAAQFLSYIATDRSRLQDLDENLRRIVLGAVLGSKDPKGFHSVPVQKMVKDWKLRSVVQLANERP